MSKSKTSNRKSYGSLYVISAASGTGKSTLANRLIKNMPDCVLSISYTTRMPRPGEQEGREYFFITPEKFQMMIKKNVFLEYALVHGNYYGTNFNQVRKAIRQGLDVFLDIDVQGAAQIRRKMKEAVSVFILPPAFEALRDRLQRRGTEDQQALHLRLQNAKKEIRKSVDYDYWIVNEEIDRSVEELKAIVTANRLRKERVSWRLKKNHFPIANLLKR